MSSTNIWALVVGSHYECDALATVAVVSANSEFYRWLAQGIRKSAMYGLCKDDIPNSLLPAWASCSLYPYVYPCTY